MKANHLQSEILSNRLESMKGLWLFSPKYKSCQCLLAYSFKKHFSLLSLRAAVAQHQLCRKILFFFFAFRTRIRWLLVKDASTCKEFVYSFMGSICIEEWPWNWSQHPAQRLPVACNLPSLNSHWLCIRLNTFNRLKRFLRLLKFDSFNVPFLKSQRAI